MCGARVVAACGNGVRAAVQRYAGVSCVRQQSRVAAALERLFPYFFDIFLRFFAWLSSPQALHFFIIVAVSMATPLSPFFCHFSLRLIFATLLSLLRFSLSLLILPFR